jgi:hypothetical protein
MIVGCGMAFWFHSRRLVFTLGFLSTLVLLLIHLKSNLVRLEARQHEQGLGTTTVAKKPGEAYSKTIVMAKTRTEDVSWVHNLEGFEKKIYTVDTTSNLTVPRNKGHEAMAYLTYIVDNYDNLPDVVLFFHPHQIAWHNNILLDVDSKKTIQRMNLEKVVRDGYFNARCHHDPGCPDWLHIDRAEAEWDLIKKKEEQYFTSARWRSLHLDGRPIPEALAQPCCAQFAVAGERIRARSIMDYVHYRQWLLDTDLEDEYSGRFFEYSWQYIFTGQSQFCPPQHQCYCDGYGICFGGTNDDNLQHWLDLVERREKLDAWLDDARADAGTHSDEIASVDQARVSLVNQIATLKAQAYLRGEDPQNRALECGREWKVGDGF